MKKYQDKVGLAPSEILLSTRLLALTPLEDSRTEAEGMLGDSRWRADEPRLKRVGQLLSQRQLLVPATPSPRRKCVRVICLCSVSVCV